MDRKVQKAQKTRKASKARKYMRKIMPTGTRLCNMQLELTN